MHFSQSKNMFSYSDDELIANRPVNTGIPKALRINLRDVQTMSTMTQQYKLEQSCPHIEKRNKV